MFLLRRLAVNRLMPKLPAAEAKEGQAHPPIAQLLVRPVCLTRNGKRTKQES